jgi:YD repeat-containing protein
MRWGSERLRLTPPSRKQAILTTNTLRIVLTCSVAQYIQYDPFGPVSGWTWGDGASTYRRTQNLDGSTASYTVGTATRTLSSDAVGNLAALTDSANSALDASYAYDALHRLTAVTGAHAEGFTYDAVGNRSTLVPASGPTTTSTGKTATTSAPAASSTAPITRRTSPRLRSPSTMPWPPPGSHPPPRSPHERRSYWV